MVKSGCQLLSNRPKKSGRSPQGQRPIGSFNSKNERFCATYRACFAADVWPQLLLRLGFAVVCDLDRPSCLQESPNPSLIVGGRALFPTLDGATILLRIQFLRPSALRIARALPVVLQSLRFAARGLLETLRMPAEYDVFVSHACADGDRPHQ